MSPPAIALSLTSFEIIGKNLFTGYIGLKLIPPHIVPQCKMIHVMGVLPRFFISCLLFKKIYELK